MIPYFEQPSLDLGPVTIYGFGIMVAAAVLTGFWMAVRRAERHGLNAEFMSDLTFFTIVVGFVLSHVVSVVFYFPERVLEDPLELVRVWNGISSYGGIFGGLFAIWIYFRWKGTETDRRRFWDYLDTIAYAFPFAWVFGRLGCTLAHDHPGKLTESFPLAISLERPEARAYIRYVYGNAGVAEHLPSAERLSSMGFHDLGFYEFLFTTLVIVPLFALLDRGNRDGTKWPSGFYLAVLAVIYSPVRFLLDFYRVGDATYAGLTPAQWMCFAFVGVGIWALRHMFEVRRQQGA